MMWHWLVETLRGNPEIAIFLTLGLGFWAGKLKFGSFSLGVVTSTLLAGVLVGQLEITISANVKSTFFLMFLFAVGYSVGPQFFRSLKGDGIQQVLFAILQCVVVLLTAVGTGYVLGYDAGGTAGLLAGSSTISAVLGVATGSINQLGVDAAAKQAMLDAMPVAYAVTYLFGTAGSAWILATLGPKILRVDIAEECRKYEAEMGGAVADDPDRLTAYMRFLMRAYRLTDTRWVGRTVQEFEASFEGQRVFVERLRQNGKLLTPTPDLRLEANAVLAIAGPTRGGAGACAIDRRGSRRPRSARSRTGDSRRRAHAQGARRPDLAPAQHGRPQRRPARRVPAQDPAHRGGDAAYPGI